MKLKRFSHIGSDYDFSTQLSGLEYSVPQLVANLIYSVAYIHLYHLCSDDYNKHVILNEYYDEMPDKADALAEHFMASNDKVMYAPSIIPQQGECPIKYLELLLGYTLGVTPSDSATQSDIDDAVGLLRSTIYKLKRLT